MILLLLAACASKDCAALSPRSEQDACWKARLDALPADPWAEADSLAGQIQDPVVRGAAVYGFISRHSASLSPAAASLCQHLSPPEIPACRRRIESKHLR